MIRYEIFHNIIINYSDLASFLAEQGAFSRTRKKRAPLKRSVRTNERLPVIEEFN